MFIEKRVFVLLQILLFSASVSICAQNASDLVAGRNVYISSPLGLNMRDQPAITGSKITALTYNSKVMILEVNDNVQKIQGKTSKWIKARYNGKTGWIFGGFVTNHLNSDSRNEFRYYLSNGRTDSYSIHIGMKISDVYNIFGTPMQTVGFMGQQVHIYRNPFLNIFGDKEIDKITWADESCGTVFGLLPEVTTEDGIIPIIGRPDEIKVIEQDPDGEAVNVGRNFLYYENSYELLININAEGFIDYLTLRRR